jgi:hypothetical protein
MFWAVVGGLLFVFVGIPLGLVAIGALFIPYDQIGAWMERTETGWWQAFGRKFVGISTIIVYTVFLVAAGMLAIILFFGY